MGPRATESFRPPPFQRAVRPAPVASRLQFAPPVGLLARISEGVQDFSVFLHELDARQIRPRRRRNVLSGRLTPQYLTQQQTGFAANSRRAAHVFAMAAARAVLFVVSVTSLIRNLPKN
jgi:hypothetical protein